jgi:hypothetical protein
MLPAKIWSIYNELGSTACRTQNFSLARKMFGAAMAVCEGNARLKRQRIRSLVGLADTCMMEHDCVGAAALYKRALNICARMNMSSPPDLWLFTHILESVARIDTEQNNLQDALKTLHRCVRLTSDRPAKIRRLMQLSLLQSRLGATDAAAGLLRQARSI